MEDWKILHHIKFSLPKEENACVAFLNFCQKYRKFIAATLIEEYLSSNPGIVYLQPHKKRKEKESKLIAEEDYDKY